MNGSSLIPCLRYRDAPRAIDWLCDALGFERHLVVPGDGGSVLHAQLRLGDGMVMLGSERDTDYGRLMRSPKDAGGNTQSVYVVVADPDSTYARAREKGAEIAVPIRDEAHGGRSFTCLDREGHVWTVGSYDPWAEPGSGAG
jgi:uncharacterized glyoxalase superfamily protein PhnB